MSNKLTACLLGIDYVAGPHGYRAVVLEAPRREPQKFATGDPVKDWSEASAAARALVEQDEAIAVLNRSSCVQFVFDVPGYRFDDNIELDPLDWTDGVLTPLDYNDDSRPD